MTIERRVDFLGVPVKKTVVDPGYEEIIGKTPHQPSLGTVPSERVFVQSDDSLDLQHGYWNYYKGYNYFLPDQRLTQELNGDQINRADIKGRRRWNGTRVVFRHIPSPSDNLASPKDEHGT